MILYTYCVTLIAGALLLIVVGQMAGHHAAARGDSKWLQWGRRSAFWITAFAALFSAGRCYAISANIDISVLVLVLTAVSILAIDVVVLRVRKLPPTATVEAMRPIVDIAARARARR